MPLYEYQCASCGHRFEKIQRFSDPPADTCPACAAGDVRKLLSAPAFQFKGTGWYITDYAGKKPGATGSAEKTGSGSTETATEAKPETKSETKSEGK